MLPPASRLFCIYENLTLLGTDGGKVSTTMPVGNVADSSPAEKSLLREEPDSFLKNDEPVGNGKATKADNADQRGDLDDSLKSRFISLALCISALLLRFGGLILWSLANFAVFYCYTGAGAQFVGVTKTAEAKVLVRAL